MNKIVSPISVNPDDEVGSFELPVPTQCPVCSVAYLGEPLSSYYVKVDDFSRSSEDVYALYFCPHCESIFFVQYQILDDYFAPMYGSPCVIQRIFPTPSSKTVFPEHIKKISPKFVEIYHQSEKAENDGLTEICGMGYRKALEFLVKDFAIHTHPDKSSEIESPKLMLSQCIKTYIDSQKIKTMAEASAWIGNDETHYTRKHENYDVQDLKRFINTAVAFIEYELNFSEASEFLNPEKSRKDDSTPK